MRLIIGAKDGLYKPEMDLYMRWWRCRSKTYENDWCKLGWNALCIRWCILFEAISRNFKRNWIVMKGLGSRERGKWSTITGKYIQWVYNEQIEC